MVNHPFREVLEGHPALDELIVHDRSPARGGFLGMAGTAGLFRKLARGRFDLTIDLQGLLRSALMTAADAVAGCASAWPTRAKGALVLHRPRRCIAAAVHAVERVRRVAAAFGASMAEPRFDLPDRAGARALGERNLERVADASDRAQPGRAVADETLASGALRRDRAASVCPISAPA